MKLRFQWSQTTGTSIMSRAIICFVAGLSFALGGTAHAQTMCVWDPLGSQGDFSALMKDYAIAALRWNVHFAVKIFTDEPTSIQAFKNGGCDLINMIGIRARSYNAFTGSIDVPGGLDNYAQMRQLLTALSADTANKYMTSGNYETAGILPIGAVYAVTNDKAISSLSTAKGKRVAVMDWDRTQVTFTEEVGAIPVAMSMTDYGQKFNAGEVDVLPVPMVLYKPMELYKGIGDKGGIIRRPILQFTLQFITNRGAFPSGFGLASRQYMLTQVDHTIAVTRKAEAEIPQGQWIYVPTQEVRAFDSLLGRVGDRLATAGYYDKRMLTIMRKIRCKDQSLNNTDCETTK